MDPAFVKMDKKKPHTEYEKQLLLQLVQQRILELDNRRTDAVTLRKKQEAWEALTNEFNNSPNISQISTSKQLKKMWQNFKAKARDAKTLEAQRKKTGGGPPPPEIGPLENQILAIIPNVLPSIDVEIDSDILYSADREEEADNDSQAWLHKKTVELIKQEKRERLSSTSSTNNNPVILSATPSIISIPVTSTFTLSSNPDTSNYTPSSNHLPSTCTPSSNPIPSTYTPSSIPSSSFTNVSTALPTADQRSKKRKLDEENYSVDEIKKRIYLEELKNTRDRYKMEAEFMLEKHKIEMEILNIKKEILLKELNK